MYFEEASTIFILVISMTTISPAASDLCTSTWPTTAFIENVPENTPVGDIIGNVYIKGTPAEVNLNQQSSDYFELNTSTRDVTLLKELDADTGITSYEMGIFCSPKSTPSQSTLIDVTIIVVDVNDNAPEFPRDVYYVNVPENSPIGSVISTSATATDADSPGGGNDQIYYFILPGPYSNYFNISNYQNSVMTLNKMLDYESLQYLNVTIQARDRYYNSSDVLSSTALVVVNVTDVDDLIPAFEQNVYEVQYKESPVPGTTLTVAPPIAAKDHDLAANSQIYYTILDPRNNFKINNVSGELTVEKTLLPGTWTICMQATQVDNVQRFGTAMLDVIINSENLNVPTFHQTLYETAIQENLPMNSKVINVQARDSDLGTVLTYNIIDATDTFTIDQTGQVISQNDIDFEKRTFYSMLVTASDGTNVATATVEITVLDINDNPPTITNTVTEVNSERTQGTILMTITVEDKDQNTSFDFEVIKDTGRMQDEEQLDKAKRKKSIDPKGLAFTKTNAPRQNSPPGDIDMHNMNDESSDGATSIQENPLVDGINYAYMQNEDMNSPELDAYVDEIQIETSVIPYKDGFKYQPNGTVYLNEAVTSFKDTSSCESINSDSLNSRKVLVPNGKAMNGVIPNHNNNHIEPLLDPDRSLVPMDEKPEITVYF